MAPQIEKFDWSAKVVTLEQELRSLDLRRKLVETQLKPARMLARPGFLQWAWSIHSLSLRDAKIVESAK